jgi:hypothetical protein
MGERPDLRDEREVRPRQQMIDITPDQRRRFPSRSRIGVNFPPPELDDRSRIIWIDGRCRELADAVIRQFKAGDLTVREAEKALYELEFGRPRMTTNTPDGATP